MKNRTWILLYLLLLVLIVFFEYKTDTNGSKTVTNAHYKIEKNSKLDAFLLSYVTPLESNLSLNKLWKIVPKKIKKEVKKEDNKTAEIKLVEVSLKKRTLCVKKECFKLLGIFQKGKDDYASFYNKQSKESVKAFKVGEVLDASIKIKSIIEKTVVFGDINSTREWHIDLFDVDISKYEPKEFE